MFLKKKKQNERKGSCSNNHLSNYTETIILLSLERIVEKLSRGLLTITTSPSANQSRHLGRESAKNPTSMFYSDNVYKKDANLENRMA